MGGCCSKPKEEDYEKPLHVSTEENDEDHPHHRRHHKHKRRHHHHDDDEEAEEYEEDAYQIALDNASQVTLGSSSLYSDISEGGHTVPPKIPTANVSERTLKSKRTLPEGGDGGKSLVIPEVASALLSEDSQANFEGENTQHHDELSWVREIYPPPAPESYPFYVTAPVEELHVKLFSDLFQLLINHGLFFTSKKGKRRPPFQYLVPLDLKREVDFRLPDDPVDHAKILEFVNKIIRYQPHAGHPLFMEQRIAGLDPYACISDMIATCCNSNNVLYIVSTTTTILELELKRAICQLVGYHREGAGDGAITPGSTLANGYAMKLAVQQKFPDVKMAGLSGCKRPVFFVSRKNVYNHVKCAIFQGFGMDSVIPIETRWDGKMDLEDLRSEIINARTNGYIPCMVIGTVGTPVIRAIDPLEKIADLCSEFDIWFHVDATWGGALLCSQKLKKRLKGVELSDSFTWSQHYNLGVPPTCSVIVVPPRHRDELTQCFGFGEGNAARASLMKTPLYDPAYDIGHNTVICCRRPEMLKFWLMWKAKGVVGMGRHMEHTFKNAQICMEEMKKREGFLPILEHFEGTNICFVYVPVVYRSIILGSDEYKEKISKLCLAIKRLVMERGVLSLSYNEFPDSKSTFLVLGLHNSAVTRKDIVYALETIETFSEGLTNPRHTLHAYLNAHWHNSR